MSGNKSVTNSTYAEFYSGRRRAYAWSASAWRHSCETTPGTDQFASVAPFQPVLLPVGKRSLGRGESGTVTINWIELDPPV